MAATDLDTTLAGYPARYFAAWNGRDLDAAQAIVADTFDWVDPSLPAPLTDLAGVRGFFSASWRAFPDLKFELIGAPLVDAEAGRVAQEWRMTGTHQGDGVPAGVPATGKSIDVCGTDVFTVAGGRATAIRAYWDAMTLARQLGLVP